MEYLDVLKITIRDSGLRHHTVS